MEFEYGAFLYQEISIKDPNEAKLLVILEALKMYMESFRELLIIESDLCNAISWAFRHDKGTLGISLLSQHFQILIFNFVSSQQIKHEENPNHSLV